MRYPNLAAEMARAGLTQEQLADRLGICRKTLYTWLNVGAPAYGIQRMAEILGVEPEYIAPDTPLDSLGARIRRARRAAGLTQEELAEAVGAATITIQQYEANRREPKLLKLKQIADTLGVSITKLLPGEEPEPEKDPERESLLRGIARRLQRADTRELKFILYFLKEVSNNGDV